MVHARQALVAASLFLSMLLLGSGVAVAVESLGTFTWRLAPFCNVVTLTLVVDGPAASVSGFDNVCGAPQRLAVTGSAFPNPNGSVAIGFTIVNPSGPPAQVQALLPAGALSGTWTDDGGLSGAFQFNPAASPPGEPRPQLRPVGGCSPDMVKNGSMCIDKWENTVWYVPALLTHLIQKIRAGTVTEADLTADLAPEPVRVGIVDGDIASFGCSASGTDAGCQDIYAVSISMPVPTGRYITWFQAAAAARNSGKRLATNAEWQTAALGTPVAACNTSGPVIQSPGGYPGCVSHVGAYDMVGNVWEWVADWVPQSTTCGTWGGFSDDAQCLAGAGVSGAPGALLRGGSLSDGAGAGVFAVNALNTPFLSHGAVGFRAAR